METPPPQPDSAKCAAEVSRPLWSIGRAVVLLLGVVLLVLAICFARDWRHKSAACDAAEAAEIGTIPVDFSRCGRYEIVVSNRYPQAHGVSHVLLLDRSPGENTSAKELLSGLTGTMKCVAADGGAFLDEAIDLDRIWARGNMVDLGGFGGGPSEYRLQVEITHGAPTLSGVRQRLCAMNAMCGLERMAAGIAGLFALAIAAIALAIFGGVWWSACRGRRLAQPRRVGPRPVRPSDFRQ